MNKKEYKKRLEKEKRELREFRESDMNTNIKTGLIYRRGEIYGKSNWCR